MPKRTGPMRKQSCYCGQSRNIVEGRILFHRNWVRMTGYKLLVSFPEETTHNVNINLIKIKNQRSRKVTGSSVRMKSLSNLFEKMVLNSGVRLPISLIQTSGLPETASNVVRDGSTS